MVVESGVVGGGVCSVSGGMGGAISDSVGKDCGNLICDSLEGMGDTNRLYKPHLWLL